MPANPHHPIASRRRLLKAATASAFAGPSLIGWTADPAIALSPTPACGAPAEPTTAQTEGPYFLARSPERDSLIERGQPGTPLLLQGRVQGVDCQALAAVRIEVWHADDAGHYDLDGYHHRGHLYSDAQGRYRLETIRPGLYPGRTRHLHLMLQAPGHRALTTQLYFPGEASNARDRIYAPELLMRVISAEGLLQLGFDFVLQPA